MSSVGIMLPEGMRKASMRNVRKNRKNASVTRIALTFSHQWVGVPDLPDAPARMAATEPEGLDACFFEATGRSTGGWETAKGRAPTGHAPSTYAGTAPAVTTGASTPAWSCRTC